MSAIEFLMGGGMASIGGDLTKEEQTKFNEITKKYGEEVRNYARNLQVPASYLECV